MSDARRVEMPEHNEFTESMVDSIDRLRDDGGLAPELPHEQPQQVQLTPPATVDVESGDVLS